jgi:hypothetical protein
MQSQIESIVFINRYLASHKDDIKKKELVRGYLTSKVNELLTTKKKEDIISKIFKMPLLMLFL